MDYEFYLCRPGGLEGNYAKLVLNSDMKRNAHNFGGVGAKTTIEYDYPKVRVTKEGAVPAGGIPLVDPMEEEDYQYYKDVECSRCADKECSLARKKSKDKAFRDLAYRCHAHRDRSEGCMPLKAKCMHVDDECKSWSITILRFLQARYRFTESCWLKRPLADHNLIDGNLNSELLKEENLAKEFPTTKEAKERGGVNRRTSQNLFSRGLLVARYALTHWSCGGPRIAAQKKHCVQLRRKRVRLGRRMDGSLPSMSAEGEILMPLPKKILKVFNVKSIGRRNDVTLYVYICALSPHYHPSVLLVLSRSRANCICPSPRRRPSPLL